MIKIVIATENPGKFKEIQAALENLPVSLIAQNAFHVPPIEETGLSFIENAILKARHASKYSNLPALADDSGLAVDALKGAPGIYSARFAGTDAKDADNIKKLLNELTTVKAENRSARFHCAIAYVRHANDPIPIICQGQWEGEILSAPQGQEGFGYDPIFFVPSLQCSAAELTSIQKNQLSHRAKALAAFVKQYANI